ncbi:hypothetical protein BDY24DRAFT_394893 [Mrakia frigida]|uniref:ER membrane protein complex subunit 8/9 family protein n=1 Tax=Mrakia frigida TaxID=29902 RepID=UPI003FCC2128
MSITPTSYSISPLAYTKIIVHAAKYPSSLVNGVLIGSQSGSTVSVVDAIPLLHHWTSLSPSMEIGLELAEFHASSQSLLIVGYYQGNEKLDDTAFSITGTKVADKIKSRFPGAFAVTINNELLATSSNALIPHLSPTPSKWTPFSSSTSFSLTDPSSPTRALTLVKNNSNNGVLVKFGDFDDHLEDVSIDWLNNRGVVV